MSATVLNKPGGPGSKITVVTDSLGLQLIVFVSPIDASDVRSAVEHVVPPLKELLVRTSGRPRTLTSAAAYQGACLRVALMRLGYVPAVQRHRRAGR